LLNLALIQRPVIDANVINGSNVEIVWGKRPSGMMCRPKGNFLLAPLSGHAELANVSGRDTSNPIDIQLDALWFRQ
jgi:hypothetical protein